MQTQANEAGRWFGNTRIAVKLSHVSNDENLSIVEHHMPHGDSAPLHLHDNEDEIFYILEGSMRFRVGEEELVAGAGQTVVAPRGIAHTYRVESEGGVRCLTIARGSEFEAMLKAGSRPAERPGLPAPAAPTPAMIAGLTELCLANNIRIMGPPLA